MVVVVVTSGTNSRHHLHLLGYYVHSNLNYEPFSGSVHDYTLMRKGAISVELLAESMEVMLDKQKHRQLTEKARTRTRLVLWTRRTFLLFFRTDVDGTSVLKYR